MSAAKDLSATGRRHKISLFEPGQGLRLIRVYEDGELAWSPQPEGE